MSRIPTNHPRIVIAGCGFAGLWAARRLARTPADILALDRNNYHTFQPLLYQVAAAELEPEDIVYPVRSILRRYKNIRFIMDDVTGVNFTAKLVKTAERDYPYDYLILAVGSTPHFYGVVDAEKYAIQLKTLDDAINLRNQILHRFECALRETDSQKNSQMLTFAIVGGGPTGVEYSGALAELINGPVKKDYPTLEFKGRVRVLLLEATDHLLPGLPDRLSRYAQARLHKKGVEVRLNASVRQITAQAVTLADGTTIPTETIIWTAGVYGNAPAHTEALPTTRNNQLQVLPTLQLPNFPEVYVTGDLAYAPENGSPLPMVGPVAIQQGEMAADNIIRQMNGQNPVPFHYRDPGTMAVIGRNAAVAYIKGRSFTGFLAWILWLGVHLYGLIGFRNRLFVLTNWAWDYFFFERTVRLIVPVSGK